MEPEPPRTDPAALEEKRPWSVKAVTWLLLLETAAFVIIAAIHWLELNLAQISLVAALGGQMLSTLAGAVAFSALAFIGLLAIASFVRLWQSGWLYAMLGQGLTLAFMLTQTFRELHFYTYGLMAYAVVMVVYLHHPDIQAAFHLKQTPANVEQVNDVIV